MKKPQLATAAISQRLVKDRLIGRNETDKHIITDKRTESKKGRYKMTNNCETFIDTLHAIERSPHRIYDLMHERIYNHEHRIIDSETIREVLYVSAIFLLGVATGVAAMSFPIS